MPGTQRSPHIIPNNSQQHSYQPVTDCQDAFGHLARPGAIHPLAYTGNTVLHLHCNLWTGHRLRGTRRSLSMRHATASVGSTPAAADSLSRSERHQLRITKCSLVHAGVKAMAPGYQGGCHSHQPNSRCLGAIQTFTLASRAQNPPPRS